MLEATSLDDIYIITSEEYFHAVLREAPEISPDHIILEPEQKNTAPAIALAMKYLKEKKEVSEKEVLFVTPSDHLISPVSKFVNHLKEGAKLATQGGIVTFGVLPQAPETGYGYLLARNGRVEKFVEKPDRQRAEEFLRDGNYFWNSGSFAFTLETMEKEFAKHAPEISTHFEKPYEEAKRTFSSLPKISLDYAIMEKASLVSMVPLYLTWSDIGSWENVHAFLDKDESGNALQGEVAAFETKNSLVVSGKRLVVTMGVSDLTVIETDDVVLVAQKEQGQKIKEVVEKLKGLGKAQVDSHVTTHRPWGSYTVLEEGVRYKIKRICVLPLAKLSLQLHYHRSEHWIVVTGTARVTINDQEKIVHEGESIFVPKSAVHRVENPGKVPLEIIEVQVGEYLGEDDIVRLEDIYGRLKEDAAFEILMQRK